MRSDGQTPKWQCSIKNGDCLKRQSPFFKIRNFPVLQGLDQIQDAVQDSNVYDEDTDNETE